MSTQDFTQLLIRWKKGDQEALKALIPIVYKELHDLAHNYLRRERSDHTLRSTALVHEAYLRLADQGPADTENHAHFVGIAARLMRQILVDYARTRNAAKRGPDCKVQLEEALALPKAKSADVLALDDALTDLARVDEQQSKIVELRFFGGLTTEETAQVLGVSTSTVKRDWNVAKAWLTREMTRAGDDPAHTVG